jgi:hypothetical protein
VSSCAASARPSWRCVGDSAADGARVGWPDPGSSAIGSLDLGAVTVGFIDTSPISTNDFSDEYRLWRSTLLEADQVRPKPVETLLQSPAFFDLGVTTEAEQRTSASGASSDRLARLQFLYPEPVVTADVVLAPLSGRALPGGLAQAAARALIGTGWRPADGSTSNGAEPALPDSSNLPGPGVMVALRKEVQ